MHPHSRSCKMNCMDCERSQANQFFPLSYPWLEKEDTQQLSGAAKPGRETNENRPLIPIPNNARQVQDGVPPATVQYGIQWVNGGIVTYLYDRPCGWAGVWPHQIYCVWRDRSEWNAVLLTNTNPQGDYEQSVCNQYHDRWEAVDGQ